ncbi:MAG TPA: hypothetical protein DC054_15820 [Blastocatellia bacterium]|nr:hypothetical protein [Blastocatellia bacterium]
MYAPSRALTLAVIVASGGVGLEKLVLPVKALMICRAFAIFSGTDRRRKLSFTFAILRLLPEVKRKNV